MCRTVSAFEAWGTVSIIKNEGHLLNSSNRLEIIFNLPNIILCSNRTVYIYLIFNMLETSGEVEAESIFALNNIIKNKNRLSSIGSD